jgi:hypothetical protein
MFKYGNWGGHLSQFFFFLSFIYSFPAIIIYENLASKFICYIMKEEMK